MGVCGWRSLVVKRIEIRRLVNDKRPAGHHRVQFEGKSLPGGVYFYRLQAGDFLQTRKLTLLR